MDDGSEATSPVTISPPAAAPVERSSWERLPFSLTCLRKSAPESGHEAANDWRVSGEIG
jgi:hypothetical protein